MEMGSEGDTYVGIGIENTYRVIGGIRKYTSDRRKYVREYGGIRI
jgi:hypothetical protein